MKKILIALDNNANAPQVALAGYGLAETLHAHITLMHVTSDSNFYSSLNYSPILGFNSFSSLGIMKTDTIQELKRTAVNYLNGVKLSLGDERIETIVKKGDYAENILQTAKELDADMIILGTHSRKGLDKVLLGSVAENVLHHTTIPLLIISVEAANKN